ncbi:MAG: hypothetical protein RL410_1501 [Actinomycetota bacterium]|jgi:hypothetical protein
MKDEGNVAVELILAITLLVSLLIPSAAMAAEFLDAKRDIHSVGVVAARMWGTNASQSEISDFVNGRAQQLFNRSMSVSVVCEISCNYPGTHVRLQVSTTVELFRRFTLTHSEYVVQNEVG